jgi:hypothetical protein
MVSANIDTAFSAIMYTVEPPRRSNAMRSAERCTTPPPTNRSDEQMTSRSGQEHAAQQLFINGAPLGPIRTPLPNSDYPSPSIADLSNYYTSIVR